MACCLPSKSMVPKSLSPVVMAVPCADEREVGEGVDAPDGAGTELDGCVVAAETEPLPEVELPHALNTRTIA